MFSRFSELIIIEAFGLPFTQLRGLSAEALESVDEHFVAVGLAAIPPADDATCVGDVELRRVARKRKGGAGRHRY